MLGRITAAILVGEYLSWIVMCTMVIRHNNPAQAPVVCCEKPIFGFLSERKSAATAGRSAYRSRATIAGDVGMGG